MAMSEVEVEPNENKSSPKSEEIEYKIFVNDISQDVDSATLYLCFARRYASCTGAKIIRDLEGCNTGYGYVRFSTETDKDRAISEMDGYLGLGGKAISIKDATNEKEKIPEDPNKHMAKPQPAALPPPIIYQNPYVMVPNMFYASIPPPNIAMAGKKGINSALHMPYYQKYGNYASAKVSFAEAAEKAARKRYLRSTMNNPQLYPIPAENEDLSELVNYYPVFDASLLEDQNLFNLSNSTSINTDQSTKNNVNSLQQIVLVDPLSRAIVDSEMLAKLHHKITLQQEEEQRLMGNHQEYLAENNQNQSEQDTTNSDLIQNINPEIAPSLNEQFYDIKALVEETLSPPSLTDLPLIPMGGNPLIDKINEEYMLSRYGEVFESLERARWCPINPETNEFLLLDC